MKISREDVLRVAELAHLELTDAEVASVHRDLDSILTYMDKLNELDTSGVEPMAQVLSGAEGGNEKVLREDVPARCDLGREVIARAADASHPYFRVPKVIER